MIILDINWFYVFHFIDEFQFSSDFVLVHFEGGFVFLNLDADVGNEDVFGDCVVKLYLLEYGLEVWHL